MKQDEGWGWINLEFGGRLHTLPMNDTKDHVVDTPFCWCHPEVDGRLVIHNADDNREAFEQGKRKPS